MTLHDHQYVPLAVPEKKSMNLKASLLTRTGAAIATAPVDFDEVALMSGNDVSGIVASSSHAEFAMDKRVVVASGRFGRAPTLQVRSLNVWPAGAR